MALQRTFRDPHGVVNQFLLQAGRHRLAKAGRVNFAAGDLVKALECRIEIRLLNDMPECRHQQHRTFLPIVGIGCSAHCRRFSIMRVNRSNKCWLSLGPGDASGWYWTEYAAMSSQASPSLEPSNSDTCVTRAPRGRLSESTAKP